MCLAALSNVRANNFCKYLRLCYLYFYIKLMSHVFLPFLKQEKKKIVKTEVKNVNKLLIFSFLFLGKKDSFAYSYFYFAIFYQLYIYILLFYHYI